MTLSQKWVPLLRVMLWHCFTSLCDVSRVVHRFRGNDFSGLPLSAKKNGKHMPLSKRQIAYLNRIILTAQKMLDTAELEDSRSAGLRSGLRRRRRSSAEAQKMRADILSKRSKGVSATQLAEKYGVSTAYIYMIK
jgi:hypothetical protein